MSDTSTEFSRPDRRQAPPRRGNRAPAGTPGRPTLRAALRLLALTGSLIYLGVAGGAEPSVPAAAGHAARSSAPVAPCISGTCYVRVNVATLWVGPWYARAIDKPVLTSPAHPLAWVGSLSDVQKAWLVGKVETQALYGTKVLVIGHWRGWAHVAVPGQPTNRDPRGYPGWLPATQLTSTAPAAATNVAVISTRSARLWNWSARRVSGSEVMLVSYDTRLPVVSVTARYVEVTLIDGRTVAVRRGDAQVHPARAAWGPTAERIIGAARGFLGLPYLWGGTSGFGYDCSGFTYAVYHSLGLTLPRDADQQAVHGTSVARGHLEAGDLVFFRAGPTGPISHVGLYLGGGSMIDAPHTGAVIRIDRVSSFAHYAGARRYLSITHPR